MTTSRNSFTHPWASKGYAIADLFPKSDSVFYRLPLAQRDYAWGEDQIIALLFPILHLAERWELTYDDLQSKGFRDVALDPQLLVEEDKIDYYTVGTATFATVSGSSGVVEKFPRSNPVLLDILDGQQRLTTMALILLACWFILEELGDELSDPGKAADLASELKERLRVTDSSRSPVPRVFRHREGELADIGTFIVDVLSLKHDRYTQHNLYEAFDTIEWCIRANCGLDPEHLEDHERLDLDLLNLVDTILYGVRCGAIVAPPGKTTETFIVINRSGQELTEMDIIKCHILDLCHQNSAQEKTAEKKFVKLLEKGNFAEVTRLWIDSKGASDKPANKKKLAENFSDLKLLERKEKASDVLNELQEASAIYTDLKKGVVDGKHNNALHMANSLKINSTYSIILAAPPAARAEVADIVSRAVTIRKICGGALMGSYHSAVFKLCGGLASGSYLAPDGSLSVEMFEEAVNKHLLSEFSRPAFIQSIEKLSYQIGDHKKIMRVLFSNVSTLLNKGFSTPAAPTDKYSLDHFHPQTPQRDDENAQEWASPDAQLLLHSVGNIAPLPNALNNKLSNSSIKDRFESIAGNAGDGIAVAKFCCSAPSDPSRAFTVAVTSHFRGNSHVASKALGLLPLLRFSGDSWTPDMTKKRTTAIAELSLILLDPEEAILSAQSTASSVASDPCDDDSVQLLFLASDTSGYDAKMKAVWDDAELTDCELLAGSFIRLETLPSASPYVLEERAKAKAEGRIYEYNGCLVLSESIYFDSPYAAATFVTGGSKSKKGKDSWVDARGYTLAALEEDR